MISGSPLVPGMPAGPMSPLSPLFPVSPCNPMGPIMPCLPLFPGDPIMPWSPLFPVFPFCLLRPRAPLCPLGPGGPGGPVGPDEHVTPFDWQNCTLISHKSLLILSIAFVVRSISVDFIAESTWRLCLLSLRDWISRKKRKKWYLEKVCNLCLV